MSNVQTVPSVDSWNVTTFCSINVVAPPGAYRKRPPAVFRKYAEESFPAANAITPVSIAVSV